MKLLLFVLVMIFSLNGQNARELLIKSDDSGKKWEIIAKERTEVVEESPLELKVQGPRWGFQYRSVDLKISARNRGNINMHNLTLMAFLSERFDFICSEPRRKFIYDKSDRSSKIVIWKNIDIAAQASVELSLYVRTSKTGLASCRVVLLGYGKTLTSEVCMPIISYPDMTVRLSDTSDPVFVGEKFTYIVEIHEEYSWCPTTYVELEYHLDDLVEFLDVEVEIHLPGKIEEVEAKYKYDEKKRKIIFEPYFGMQTGQKNFYFIHCKAIKAGKSKNTAWVKEARGIKAYDKLDEEETDIIE